MTPTIIVRASATTGYPDCNRRGAATIFRKLVETAGYTLRSSRVGVAAHIGSGVHGAAAATLDRKAATGLLMPTREMVEVGIAAYDARAAEEGAEYDDETGNRDGAHKQVARMSLAYQVDVAPRVNPLVVERRLEVDATPRLVLSGQADQVAREPGAIRDLKTGKRLGYHLPQIGSYALLTRAHRDLEVGRAFIDFVRRAPLTKPQPAPITVEYDVATAEQAATDVIGAIDRDLRAFVEGSAERHLASGDHRAFLANPNSMLCGIKYCPAHGTDFCPESKGLSHE